jgi:hypothetical protein
VFLLRVFSCSDEGWWNELMEPFGKIILGAHVSLCARLAGRLLVLWKLYGEVPWVCNQLFSNEGRDTLLRILMGYVGYNTLKAHGKVRMMDDIMGTIPGQMSSEEK